MIKVKDYILIDDKRTSLPFFFVCVVFLGLKVKNWASLINSLDKFESANDRLVISSIYIIVRISIYSSIFSAVEFISVGSSDLDLDVL